ncbi:hypothetical protein X975_17582, partial [Stegodyphus mimosarum]
MGKRKRLLEDKQRKHQTTELKPTTSRETTGICRPRSMKRKQPDDARSIPFQEPRKTKRVFKNSKARSGNYKAKRKPDFQNPQPTRKADRFNARGMKKSNVMPFDTIIGMDILKQGEVNIKKDGVRISKHVVKQIDLEDVYINIISLNQTFELEIYPTAAKEHVTTIENLVTDYRPLKTKTTDIEMIGYSNYCSTYNIQHIQITTELPCANWQIERLKSIIISVLSKLPIQNPSKWYTHVGKVQQVINSTYQRSINTTPFELMFETKMKSANHNKITVLLNADIQSDFVNARDDLHKETKQQILKVQAQNRKAYNLRRKPSPNFQLHDVEAIKRTRYGPGLKLKPKFLGPYKIMKNQAK